MFRFLSFILPLLLNVAFLSANTGKNAYTVDEELKGVYRLYDFDAPRKNVSPPKGYKVFYLSHYGRHGARYIHRESEYDTLNVVLHRESLTPYGEKVREKFDEYYPLLEGNAGDLSDLGKRQHRLLARRMIEDYPVLFKRGSSVVAHSSDIPRCMMSMFNFLDELKQNRKALDINIDYQSSMAPILFRPSAVKRFPVEDVLKANFDPNPLFERLFASPQEAMKRTSAVFFAQILYYYTFHLEGAGIEDDFFESVLSEAEIRALHKVESEKFSHQRGSLCPENMALGRPALEEILNSAIKDMATGNPKIRLRFGHDTMVMHLMVLLGLPPFDKARFNCSDVPMASNIRFVFAKNKSGSIVVKIQYNESDVTDWTPWEKFRSYCQTKINWDPKQRSVLEHNSIYSPLFMAHRGLQPYGPENSFSSFKAAAEKGMWAIESDFRMTKDGYVVCIHDNTLDRTTDGVGPVIEKTLAEIKALKIKPVNTKSVKPLYDFSLISDEDKKVPTMDEYLNICKTSGCVAFIELKEDKGIVEKMITSIDKFDLHQQCVISSGKLELLERYRALGGKELIHLIFAKPEDLPKVQALGNASVSFKYSDLDVDVDLTINDVKITSLKELVDYVHSLGVKICFRAADDYESAIKAIELGVDYLPTNVMYTLD